ncbi:bifunctional folate synthesis protein [Lentisphaera araneosa HTCC2155]|jgi:2-amino-4-hydroxy-6-hydroxymethyldihydropteridine diphosphokinase|uniref:2-amino-4-hydroxy-6-hydroxymethyldihydropteridine pyrophosphokinase n=1 Tax=Lentisphaera araneosa HTCC2155 TaxID=313628 RepID=A6DJB8_9BACT|nr:2-amino-4-hydroxy-6-hydroxymethyldihydropteridine diphosphokinase [Lentisphaera araneosa]EDM28554.1 bifunctional folate synthesis protein [Lentisphaera araneosa HTCC2155]
MKTAYVAIGSNIDPFDSVSAALVDLENEFKITAVSKFYLNGAVGTSEGQHEFLNGVVRFETDLDPYDLKYRVLRSIEQRFGRQDGEHKHDERKLDLDLILYGSLVVTTEHIQLPHPEILTRDFVYVPLLEIVPGLVHPQEGLLLADLVDGEARKMQAYKMGKSHYKN